MHLLGSPQRHLLYLEGNVAAILGPVVCIENINNFGDRVILGMKVTPEVIA